MMNVLGIIKRTNLAWCVTLFVLQWNKEHYSSVVLAFSSQLVSFELTSIERNSFCRKENFRSQPWMSPTTMCLSIGDKGKSEAVAVKIGQAAPKDDRATGTSSPSVEGKAPDENSTDFTEEDSFSRLQQQLKIMQIEYQKIIESAAVQFEQAQESWDEILRNLAALSLKDYEWRSEIFKERRANRALEESLARMRGESASYVRPMYAEEDKMGPLGKAEKQAVEWLYEVIEEEAKRAKMIAEGGGKVVRPLEMAKQRKRDNQALLPAAEEEFGSFIAMSKPKANEEEDEIGPLAALELKAVEFLEIIRESETERATLGKLRPMDLEEAKRGPLGKAEANLVSALEKIKEAEISRMQQSRQRGGAVVRPIDVPGPLGEIEKAVLTIVTAEKKRAREGQMREDGKIVRPMEASVKGPLGSLEKMVSDALDMVNLEERERLQNFRRYLQERRPMENDKNSIAGFLEALIVGISRGPRLFIALLERIQELLHSEPLSEEEQYIVSKKGSTSDSVTKRKSRFEEGEQKNKD